MRGVNWRDDANGQADDSDLPRGAAAADVHWLDTTVQCRCSEPEAGSDAGQDERELALGRWAPHTSDQGLAGPADDPSIVRRRDTRR